MMAKFIKSVAGRGRHRVEALALEVKDSTLIWFLGGERPHIGAVAVAQSRSSLKDPS